MAIPPLLNDEEVALKLRSLKKQMSILQMERVSGVDRQVLYRIMGGSSVNRSPYELVIKVLGLIERYTSQELEDSVSSGL